jgi:hypothetical protein
VREDFVAKDQVAANLAHMDDLDFKGWNSADWHGQFARFHTNEVMVDWRGQQPTHGLDAHIDAMQTFVQQAAGGDPPQIVAHPIRFGADDWTCVVGEFADGSRMVTVARWHEGKIAEEHIWS